MQIFSKTIDFVYPLNFRQFCSDESEESEKEKEIKQNITNFC